MQGRLFFPGDEIALNDALDQHIISARDDDEYVETDTEEDFRREKAREMGFLDDEETVDATYETDEPEDEAEDVDDDDLDDDEDEDFQFESEPAEEDSEAADLDQDFDDLEDEDEPTDEDSEAADLDD